MAGKSSMTSINKITSPTILASVLRDTFVPVEDEIYDTYPYHSFDASTYLSLPSDSTYPMDMCFMDDDAISDAKSVVESDTSSHADTDSSTLPTPEVILALKIDGVECFFRALLDSGTSHSLVSQEAAIRAELAEQPNVKTK
jgi:hypothetical protein